MPRSTKPKKITVLKDGPIKAPKRAVRPKLTARKTFDGPACGQCEEKAGALSCMECAELYCAACFAQFHLKGALKLHRSVPYQAGQELRRSKNDSPLSPDRAIALKSNQQTERSSIDSTIAPEAMSSVESRQQKKSPVSLSNQQVSNGPSLLDGDYNEAESSASFAAALAEWRGQPQVTSKPTSSPHQSKPGVTTVNEGTGTEQEPKHEIKIEFKESMSYADKLLLKKHRRTELPQIQTPRLETGRESNSRMYTQSVSPRETLNASSSNGLVDFDDDEELELELQEEHLRYASMFSTTSPVADGEIRCNSVVTITPLPENIDTSVIEEQTSYLVQEEPDDEPIMYTAQQPQIATTKGNNKKTSESSKINRKDENGKNVKKQREKKSASENQRRYLPRPPSDNSKRKSTESKIVNNKIENKGDSKQDIKEKNRHNVNGPRRTSSRNRKLKISPDIMNNDGPYKKLESDQQNQDVKRVGKKLPKRPVSVQNQQKTSGGASKDNVRAASEKKRAASAGITRKPSEDLVKTSKLAWKAQHQYQHGLDEFFTAGMGGQGSKPVQRTIEPSNAISTSLPKCSFQGAGYWRPDSSLSTVDVTYTTVTQFNAEDRNQASRKQQSRSTISYKLSQDKTNYSGSLDRKSATPTQRKPSKNMDRTPPNGGDSRPKSCIEIEGDDFRIYDEDYLKLGKEVTADDEDTLEQLALELESGRNSEVDGPLSRLSMLEDFPDGEYEDQLGIVQDDGLGSGLSTPCEELNIEHEMDEESLKSDFKEDERAQSVMEVNALQ
ncbi:uncharacterized protein [Antedon mediterranea]|uniref:uncharacterized protein n=1 Tax=Antedon mediterranea TaxID=105859 RepID=UPI003AF4588C